MAIHFDMSDLRLVIHVAEMNSLTGGAGKVFLSLPAASTRLRRLEDNLGLKLFNRTVQGLTLTQAGQVVLRHSRMVNLQLERMCGELHPYVQGLKGSLRIAASTAAVIHDVPALLPSYLAAYPDVDVEIVERQNHEILRAVSEGAAEIGIVSGDTKGRGLAVIPYRNDRLVLVASPDHVLGECEQIDFAATLAYDHVGLKEGSSLPQFLIRTAADTQSVMRFRASVCDVEVACRIVEANAAIGIFPESAVRRRAHGMRVCCIKLSDDWAAQKISLVVKDIDELPNFADGFIDMMLDSCRFMEAA